MNHQKIIALLEEIGQAVCRKVWESLKEQSSESLSAVHKEGKDDTIYQIDRDVEELIVPYIQRAAGELGGIVLMAEGVGDAEEGVVFPTGMSRSEAALRIIMDPIDGTRGIMYDKRAAFFLAGVAPNKGESNKISDIEVALMTELPTSKAMYSDCLWAVKGQGMKSKRVNLMTGTVEVKQFAPSKSSTIIGGFAQLARFFPPGRAILAGIEDELIETIAPEVNLGKAIVFEDQYISTGGQLYEILCGHDRFIADIRSVLYKKLEKEGKKSGHVCHPYDICTVLIAREAGVIITDAYGNPFDAPMDLLSPVDWIGYANEQIYHQVWPVLSGLMKKYGLTA